METKLHNVDTMQAKVSALEESTRELGTQQDMLLSAVERIDLAQTRLVTNVGHDTTQSTTWLTTTRRPPPARRRRG
jgi:hypothetical protein